MKSEASADEAWMTWKSTVDVEKFSIEPTPCFFSKAERTAESRFLATTIKSLPSCLVSVVEMYQHQDSFGLAKVLFEIMKRVKIFTIKGSIAVVDDLHKHLSGVKNRQLCTELANFSLKLQKAEMDGELGEIEFFNYNRCYDKINDLMSEREAIEVELKTWKISNPVPHPVVPRNYFMRYLAICESLAQANFGHLELLDSKEGDRE